MNPNDVSKCCDIQCSSWQYYNNRSLEVMHHADQAHHFWTDAQRSAFLEGKVGMRESVAMRNIPPINA